MTQIDKINYKKILNSKIVKKKLTIGVIGLGYVGLPLAVEFAKKHSVVGFDLDKKRVDSLKKGIDLTLEVLKQDILDATDLLITNKVEDLTKASIYIVTVPTPINKHTQPDLTPLLKASETIGRLLKKDDEDKDE